MAFLFRLLSRLPLPLLHNLGALFGWLHWLASPVYRRHMRENMALAGVGDAWSGAIAEAGKTIFELPKLWARPHAEAGRAELNRDPRSGKPTNVSGDPVVDPSGCPPGTQSTVAAARARSRVGGATSTGETVRASISSWLS